MPAKQSSQGPNGAYSTPSLYAYGHGRKGNDVVHVSGFFYITAPPFP